MCTKSYVVLIHFPDSRETVDVYVDFDLGPDHNNYRIHF